MTSLKGLIDRLEILETLIGERDARITTLERAIEAAEIKAQQKVAKEPSTEDKHDIIHLKGFGLRICFDDNGNNTLSKDIVDYIVSLNPKTIVWDGDSYADTSFTRLIPTLHTLLPKCEFIAYLRDEDQDRFYDSWNPIFPASDYKVELQPNSCDWTELGSTAFKATGSTIAVCFGGGPVVLDEYNAALERATSDLSIQPVTFHWWPVSRPTVDSAHTEECALASVACCDTLIKHGL